MANMVLEKLPYPVGSKITAKLNTGAPAMKGENVAFDPKLKVVIISKFKKTLITVPLRISLSVPSGMLPYFRSIWFSYSKKKCHLFFMPVKLCLIVFEWIKVIIIIPVFSTSMMSMECSFHCLHSVKKSLNFKKLSMMNAFVHWLEMDTAMMKVTPKARFFYEFHIGYTCEMWTFRGTRYNLMKWSFSKLDDFHPFVIYMV